MRTVGILRTNFLRTSHTTGVLKSISGLTLGIENNCLKKFNISSYYSVIQKNTNAESVFIGTLTVSKESLEAFITTIGYRYCYHKTLKASVTVMYYRIANTYSEDASNFIEMIGANCIYQKTSY